MITKVVNWGNSLAVRIPKPVADELELVDSSRVELKLEAGGLVLRPVKEEAYSLAALVSRIDEANLHGEVGTGSPQGNEAW